MSDWWHAKSLNELTREEWEALCDGCAKCCLHKLQDADDGQVYYTGVHCRFLDADSCRCGDYRNRLTLEPNCVSLDVASLGDVQGLPRSCAYRLRAEGRALYDWHPLVSRDKNSVHSAGMSIMGRAVSAEYVHPEDIDEHIVKWVDSPE